MREEYIEKIYAGWLGKIIGIRMGAPIEGWTYEKIKEVYGELRGYPQEYKRFAADDDSNGPIFFLRALEDKKPGTKLTAQDVAEALLNYAPYEHGFFWWGGYGTSTEHTAYLNLLNGIEAPRSGSMEQNGSTAAEQIGGQIFIDTWGLVAAGNPDLAASLAKEAASVTHGGNGVWGGVFVAVCISFAFVEKDIKKILEKGLSYIPTDCTYAAMVKAVMEFYETRRSEAWMECFDYIYHHFGYDKYPGNCHIIPNAAVMILALLYGEGDFARTLEICNRCGWDTDCNVGNLGTIMGVRNGLEGIPADLRAPVNDFLACSSVVGSLNLMDLPFGGLYIAKLAYELAEEEMPQPFKTLAKERIDSCHFEFPGSTHALEARVKTADGSVQKKEGEAVLENTEETAHTGKRSLRIRAELRAPQDSLWVWKKTYCTPQDFDDSRYDPSFSPLVYPGQTIRGSACILKDTMPVQVCLYAREQHSGRVYLGDFQKLQKGTWSELTCRIPQIPGGLIEEIGFCFQGGKGAAAGEVTVYIDDLYAEGKVDYSVEFSKEKEEIWQGLHREISQFTRLKGIAYLEQEKLHLSCCDLGAVYTGRHDWKDYEAEFTVTPVTGKNHYVNVRVQGAMRAYAVGLLPDQKAGILKNEKGWRILEETAFPWQPGEEYRIRVQVKGNEIRAVLNGDRKLFYRDDQEPYLQGSIGLTVEKGSHMSCTGIRVS